MSSLKLLTAALVVALSLAFGSSVALAEHDNRNPRAAENCGRNIDKQTENGIEAGGGKKAGIVAPTNCDHYFNTP